MKEFLRSLVSSLLSRLPPGLFTDRRFFSRYQAHDIHALGVHFYSPVPDTRTLSDNVFERRTGLAGIKPQIEEQRMMLASESFSKHVKEFRDFNAGYEAIHGTHLHLGLVDGAVLHHMVRDLKPKRVIEVGQGSSTRIILNALQMNGGIPSDGYFKSIDPYPSDFISDEAFAGIDVIRSGVQTLPLAIFEDLQAGDILFIDSTHVVKIDSDVVYEINEILPRLAEGVHIHFHDIYFPFEYSRGWVMERHIFWNEQYMLQAFLAFNDVFEIEWGAGIARAEFPTDVQKHIPEFDPNQQMAGSIWIKRKLLR